MLIEDRIETVIEVRIRFRVKKPRGSKAGEVGLDYFGLRDWSRLKSK